MTFTYSLEETNKIAKLILSKANTRIFLFEGDLGAGKTTLIKSFVKHLGSKSTVTSPSFSLVNDYSTINDNIYHIDLYRVENLDEVLNIGIEDYLEDQNWVFIEWYTILKPILPINYEKITIKTSKNNRRNLNYMNFNSKKCIT